MISGVAVCLFFLLLLIFVSQSDGTVVMFVGSVTIFSGLLLHSILSRTTLARTARVLLVLVSLVLAAVLAFVLATFLRS